MVVYVENLKEKILSQHFFKNLVYSSYRTFQQWLYPELLSTYRSTFVRSFMLLSKNEKFA